MAPSTLRHQNSDPALERARKVIDPWFRCQSLADVAEVTKDRVTRIKLVREALAAADQTVEPNRIASVASWPLGVLRANMDYEVLGKETRRLLGVIAREPHPIRRADGLWGLVWNTRDGPEDVFREALGAFLDAVKEARPEGWRRNRMLWWACISFADQRPDLALSLYGMTADRKYRKKAEKELQSAGLLEGRGAVWTFMPDPEGAGMQAFGQWFLRASGRASRTRTYRPPSVTAGSRGPGCRVIHGPVVRPTP